MLFVKTNPFSPKIVSMGAQVQNDMNATAKTFSDKVVALTGSILNPSWELIIWSVASNDVYI